MQTPEYDGPNGAYYDAVADEIVLVDVNETEPHSVRLDIRDAVFLRWALGQAIGDYAKEKK